MTAYKRPVFFDRDIKSFSELSADSGLDLGIVARSILADAYLQVGTTDSAGIVSVKNASDAETINLDGATATATVGGSADGTISVKSAGNAEFAKLSVAAYGAGELLLGDGATNYVQISGWGAITAGDQTLGGSAYGGQGFVDLKDSNDSLGATIRGNGTIATKALTDKRVVFAQNDGGICKLVDYAGFEFDAGTLSVNNDIILGAGGTGGIRAYHAGDLAFSVDLSSTYSVLRLGTTNGAASAGMLNVSDVNNGTAIALDGSTASITLTGAASKITGLVLSEITGGTDAASKAYVDSIAQGLNIKGACHVSSQGNLADLATTTEVDGHTLSVGERVLVRYQELPEQNGIYRFNGAGLERAADMAVGSHAAGAFTFVQFGTNADQGWVCTADAPADVVGTDALPWTQFSAAGVIEAGDGLQLIGTVMSAKLDGSTLAASASGLKVLGLPSLFEVNGIAVGEGVSAANLTTLTSGLGSDAKALHSHFGDRIVLPVGTIEGGKCAVINASGEADIAGTTASGAWVVGFCTGLVEGYAGAYITRSGLAESVLFSATPGDVYYLQSNGTVGTALPTEGRVIMVGVAASASDLFVQIRDFGSILAA